MKSCLAAALVLFAGVAFASTFSGTAAGPKGLVTSPIAQRVSAVSLPAENAYRKSPQTLPENSTLAKAEIETAIAKVVGLRVSMWLKVDDIQARDGKTILIGRVPATGKIVWDKESELQVEMRRRDLEDALNTKIQPPVLRTEVERLQDRIAAAKQAYRVAQENADEKASARIPAAVIEVECAELPPAVRKGMKSSLMGWIREIQVSPVVHGDIAYAAVKMVVVFDRPVNAAFAATRPAAPATRPAASQPATTSQPAATTSEQDQASQK